MFSACAVALATGLLAVTAKRLGASFAPSLLTALVFAAAAGVWRHATIPGVASLTLLVSAATFTLIVHDRLVEAAAGAGVALATHPITIWLLPGGVITALGNFPRERRAIVLAGCAFAFAGGLALYAYLPIRGALNTARNDDPTAALPIATHAIWDYDHPESLSGFIRLVSGSDFPVTTRLKEAVEYKNYGAALRVFSAMLRNQYGLLGMFLMFAGIVFLWRRRWIIAVGLLVAAFGVFPFSIVYAAADVGKYYLPALWICAVLIALGATAIENIFAELANWLRFAPVLALALLIAVNLRAGAGTFVEQRSDHSAASFISNVRLHTPDEAIIAAPWGSATPLFYAAYVTRTLGHRLIVTNVDNAQIGKLAHFSSFYAIWDPRLDFGAAGVKAMRVPGVEPELFRVELVPRGR